MIPHVLALSYAGRRWNIPVPLCGDICLVSVWSVAYTRDSGVMAGMSSELFPPVGFISMLWHIGGVYDVGRTALHRSASFLSRAWWFLCWVRICALPWSSDFLMRLSSCLLLRMSLR